MANLVCIKHPHYTGEEAPLLSCKTCCSIYIGEIKAQQYATINREFDAKKWIAEAREKRRARAENDDDFTSFNPELI